MRTLSHGCPVVGQEFPEDGSVAACFVLAVAAYGKIGWVGKGREKSKVCERARLLHFRLIFPHKPSPFLFALRMKSHLHRLP
jgi:hypothetical protein